MHLPESSRGRLRITVNIRAVLPISAGPKIIMLSPHLRASSIRRDSRSLSKKGRVPLCSRRVWPHRDPLSSFGRILTFLDGCACARRRNSDTDSTFPAEISEGRQRPNVTDLAQRLDRCFLEVEVFR